jgi:hypothetical protein
MDYDGVNYMEHSPSVGPSSCPASVEMLQLLYNAKVYYRVHKRPPFGNQVTTCPNAAYYI